MNSTRLLRCMSLALYLDTRTCTEQLNDQLIELKGAIVLVAS